MRSNGRGGEGLRGEEGREGRREGKEEDDKLNEEELREEGKKGGGEGRRRKRSLERVPQTRWCMYIVHLVGCGNVHLQLEEDKGNEGKGGEQKREGRGRREEKRRGEEGKEGCLCVNQVHLTYHRSVQEGCLHSYTGPEYGNWGFRSLTSRPRPHEILIYMCKDNNYALH